MPSRDCNTSDMPFTINENLGSWEIHACIDALPTCIQPHVHIHLHIHTCIHRCRQACRHALMQSCTCRYAGTCPQMIIMRNVGPDEQAPCQQGSESEGWAARSNVQRLFRPVFAHAEHAQQMPRILGRESLMYSGSSLFMPLDSIPGRELTLLLMTLHALCSRSAFTTQHLGS